MFSPSCRKRSIIVLSIIVVGILPVLLYSLISYPSASGPIEPSAFRDSPLHEQWAAVLTGFGVKPAYMALSLVLVIILWRRKLPELAALRWGLLCFFLGGLGVHRFYVGKVGTGLLQLLTFGGLGIWAMVDFIMIVTGNFKDKAGLPVKSS